MRVNKYQSTKTDYIIVVKQNTMQLCAYFVKYTIVLVNVVRMTIAKLFNIQYARSRLIFAKQNFCLNFILHSMKPYFYFKLKYL